MEISDTLNSMNIQSSLTILLLIIANLTGCANDEQKVGQNFTLVTPSPIGPDSHPGAYLTRQGIVVWNNVYTGYFHPNKPASFYHDGTFVFVAPVPGETDWSPHSKLFVIGREGLPLMISERVLSQPSSLHEERQITCDVQSLSIVEKNIRVVFTCPKGNIAHDLTWDEIAKMLNEAETSGKVIRNKLGDYRVLPAK
jgi:hypothetical protein